MARQQAAPPPEKDRSLSKEQREAMEKQNKEREAQIAKNKALNEAFTAGKAAVEAKNWDGAIENFKKASEMEGGNQSVIWANLADAYANAAKEKPTDATTLRQSAIDAYKKAIELKPDDASLYNNYALVLGYQKQIPEAQAALEKAAQLDPPGAGRYYYNLGAVLVNTGQNDPAGVAFKKAIDADPNYADAQYQYGIFLTSQAKTDTSGKVTAVPGTIEAFQKYLDLKPDGPFADSAKGMITDAWRHGFNHVPESERSEVDDAGEEEEDRISLPGGWAAQSYVAFHRNAHRMADHLSDRPFGD